MDMKLQIEDIHRVDCELRRVVIGGKFPRATVGFMSVVVGQVSLVHRSACRCYGNTSWSRSGKV